MFRTQEAPEPESSGALDKFLETDFNAIGLKPGRTAEGRVCWRIEFRPMDIQLTDFDNAALTISLAMITNVINTFDLDFFLPISLVEENMRRAHLRDALTQGTFWWKIPKEEFANITRINDLEETNYLKSNLTTFGRPREEDFDNTGHFHHQHHKHSCSEEKKEEVKRYKELSIAQILDGDSNLGLPKGLITMIEEYMEINDWEDEHIEVVMKMLSLLLARARGQLPTGASFMRGFVKAHPDYHKD